MVSFLYVWLVDNIVEPFEGVVEGAVLADKSIGTREYLPVVLAGKP